MSMGGDNVGEVLSSFLLPREAVPRRLPCVAHALDEVDLIVETHCGWTFHELMNHLLDEEVLLRVVMDPSLVPDYVLPESLEDLGIGHDDGLLPAVLLEGDLAPLAEQDHRTVPSGGDGVLAIPDVAMAMAVGDLVVLDDDCRVIPGEEDVGDVHADLPITASVALLGHPVSGHGQLVARRKGLVDQVEEDALGRIAELMSRVDREQPREDIGELLLVRPVMHHPEHIELLCEAPRQG